MRRYERVTCKYFYFKAGVDMKIFERNLYVWLVLTLIHIDSMEVIHSKCFKRIDILKLHVSGYQLT